MDVAYSVDVAYSQSGNKFGFKILVSDIGQGSNSYLETVKLMFSSNYDSRFMCTSCAEPHSIFNKDVLNIFLADRHVPGVVPCQEGRCMIMCTYGIAPLDILRRHIVLPIEIDKGQNVSNDRNGAVNIGSYQAG